MTPKKKPSVVVLTAAMIGGFAGWQVAKLYSAQYFPRTQGEMNYVEIALSALGGGLGAAIAGGVVQAVGRMVTRLKNRPNADHVE